MYLTMKYIINIGANYCFNNTKQTYAAIKRRKAYFMDKWKQMDWIIPFREIYWPQTLNKLYIILGKLPGKLPRTICWVISLPISVSGSNHFKTKFALYAVSMFWVEVTYDAKDNRITGINSFVGSETLDKYSNVRKEF